jgi:hypothetical protein
MMRLSDDVVMNILKVTGFFVVLIGDELWIMFRAVCK